MLRASALLALLLLAVAPAASAHAEDAQNHFTVVVKDLSPRATHEIHATFEEGPLREGWVMILVGGLVNGTELQGKLRLNETVVTAWTWTGPAGRILLESTALPATSEDYVIELTNPTDEPAKFFFYFDQSCDCYGKPLPFPGAWAIFNFDFRAGETAWFDLDVQNATVKYDVLTRPGPGGTYPQDFEVVKRFPEDALPNGTMTWKVEEDRTYYFLAQSTGGAEGFATPNVRVSVDSGKDTPLPLALAVCALALAAVALRRLPSRRA